jgi:hypothetical protein
MIKNPKNDKYLLPAWNNSILWMPWWWINQWEKRETAILRGASLDRKNIKMESIEASQNIQYLY